MLQDSTGRARNSSFTMVVGTLLAGAAALAIFAASPAYAESDEEPQDYMMFGSVKHRQ